MLTVAQYTALKSDITTRGLDSNPNTSDGNLVIQGAYGVNAAPPYWVWKSLVLESDIYELTSPDGTTWDWTQYIAQSVTEQGSWRQMVSMRGGLVPALANVRAGFNKIFAGAGAGPTAQRAHILSISRRQANIAEKLFAAPTAGGTGNPGIATNPATLVVEGLLSLDDIQAARAL